MKIFIVTMGHEFPIEIGNQEQIIEIKRKIEQFIGIPIESQTLSVYGCELVDGLVMEDYDQFITEDSRIDLSVVDQIIAPSNEFPIAVEFSGQRININIDKTETVHSLKQKIQIIYGLPIQTMSLFHSGMELGEDCQNVSEFGIGEFSEVIVFMKTTSRYLSDDSNSRRKVISFVVETSSSLLNAACIPMEMKDSSTVKDVKELLLGGKILPDDEYLFIHKQRIMREKRSLRWHGVENGDFLYVFKGTVSRGEFY
ncbi:ubiquitin domain-containing protein [Cucumis melo var. makuwa]|uniref:Ubiquitin domain-containing protein n=1 Tax=Cucumis melo var. makuwa TaxID=1194695 RepID=A0A5D3C719_CUCMM|nr:ubiquitin domain-containing protein [Cucumis melo var. makuwa]TYK07092.1 ubiquitin domain-containing protein [Cucumis melo var. makuwa]